MAHELEIVNGQAQMAYVGDVPWHGLGTKVPADLTPDQFMEKAGLNWSVEKEDILTRSGIKVKNKQALVRSSDGSILDVVGNGWNPVQNAEAFNFFEEYVTAGDMGCILLVHLKMDRWYGHSQKRKIRLSCSTVTKPTTIFCLPIHTSLVKQSISE